MGGSVGAHHSKCSFIAALGTQAGRVGSKHSCKAGGWVLDSAPTPEQIHALVDSHFVAVDDDVSSRHASAGHVLTNSKFLGGCPDDKA